MGVVSGIRFHDEDVVLCCIVLRCRIHSFFFWIKDVVSDAGEKRWDDGSGVRK